MNTCPYCGVSIAARRVQCGAVECRRQWTNERMRRLNARHRAETGTSFWQKQRRRSERTCEVCESTFFGRSDQHGRTCSRICTALLRGERTECRVPSAHPSRRVLPPRRTWTSGRCRRCGDWFVTHRSQARFCSDTCKLRDKASRRRALEAGCKITPGRRYEVFDRDDWICQICGDRVNPAASVPDLDAAVVDHRVPLAAGGDHGPDNWQTAHFYCNSVKRDLLHVA